MSTDSVDPAELARLFAGVAGQADSEGGLISVTVDPKGCVKSIVLDPKVAAVSTDRLAHVIAHVCQSAFNNRIDKLGEVLDDYSRAHDVPGDVIDYLRTSLSGLRQQPDDEYTADGCQPAPGTTPTNRTMARSWSAPNRPCRPGST